METVLCIFKVNLPFPSLNIALTFEAILYLPSHILSIQAKIHQTIQIFSYNLTKYFYREKNSYQTKSDFFHPFNANQIIFTFLENIKHIFFIILVFHYWNLKIYTKYKYVNIKVNSQMSYLVIKEITGFWSYYKPNSLIYITLNNIQHYLV